MTTTARNDDRLLDTLREVVDNVAVGKVFGTPIERDGALVIPVAVIGGGAGGGSGEAGPGAKPDKQGTGMGAGLGIGAKPAGLYVLRNGKVQWHPAVDVNKIVIGGQLVLVAALLIVRSMVKTRSARKLRLRANRAAARKAVRRLKKH